MQEIIDMVPQRGLEEAIPIEVLETAVQRLGNVVGLKMLNKERGPIHPLAQNVGCHDAEFAYTLGAVADCGASCGRDYALAAGKKCSVELIDHQRVKQARQEAWA